MTLIFRLIKWLALVLLAVLVVLFVIILTLGLISRSERGSAWLIGTAVEQFVDQGEVGAISGSLARGLTVTSFHGSFGGVAVATEQLEVRLPWTALLRSRLHIEHLVLAGLQVDIPETEEEPEPDQPPAAWPSLMLPLEIQLDRLQLTDTIIRLGEQEHRLSRVSVGAHLNPLRLEIAELHIQYEDLDVSLNGRVGTRFPYPSDLRIGWLLELPEVWSGRGRIGGDLDELVLEHRLTGLATVDSNATIQPGLDREFIVFELDKLQADMSHRAHVHEFLIETLDEVLEATARVDLSGGAHAWQVTSEGKATLGDYPELSLEIIGFGDLERFQLERLLLHDGSGRLSGDGEMAWAPQLRGDLALTIEALDLSPWVPEAALILDGDISTTLDQVGADPRVAVALQPLAVRYGDLQVLTTGSARWHPERTEIEALDVAASGNRLRLDGHLTRDDMEATWLLDAPAVDAFGNEFFGTITSEGRLSGTLGQPHLEATLQGRALRLPGVTVDSISLRVRPEGDADNHHVQLDVQGAGVGDTVIDEVRLRLNGGSERHRLAAAAAMDLGSVSLALSGGYDGNAWKGQIESLTLNVSEVGEWATREATMLSASPAAQALSPLCLWQEDSRLCVEASGGTDRNYQGKVELAHFPLHRFNEYWPVGTGIRGWLEGEAEVELTDNGPHWQAELLSDEGEFLYAAVEDEIENFSYRQLRLSSQGTDTLWQASGGIELSEKGYLQFDAGLNPGNDQLRGQMEANFSELGWLEMFTNPVSDIVGQLALNFDIAGTRTEPALSGQLALDDFGAYIAPLGIQLEDGRLEGRLDPYGLSDIRGGISSGEGRLSLESSIDLSDTADWRVEINVSGNRLLVIDTPEIHSRASPELQARLTPERGVLNGRIGLSDTRIRLVELPAGQQTIVVSGDEVIRSLDIGEDPPPPYDLRANIEVIIEDEVDFEGYGLTARAEGRIATRYRAGSPLIGEGRFALTEGRYRAYGQNLVIERGEVYFNGPVDNPAIDIRAARTVRGVTAGIQLGGRVQSLTSSIYSDPPMSPSDAMAFLLTGRPLSGASQDEADMLLNAVAALGVEHGEMITGGIQSAFGLDTFAIEGGDTLQDTALVVGKNLTPRLLLSYSEKLFERTSTVALSYELTRRTTVQAESGDGQSIDVIFTDEFGQ